jgi:diguanylate cyclase (GGDEF)-like protein
MPRLVKALNPFTNLRPRLGLLVFAAVAALVVFVSIQSGERLKRAYHDAGQTQLEAIATTMTTGFHEIHHGDLMHPDVLQERINRLRKKIPTLHKVSFSWHDDQGRTLLVQSGHTHDPDGTKRDVTTHRVEYRGQGTNPAPIDARDFGPYREVHGIDGIHYGELNRPVKHEGHTLAAVELHYDLKELDLALARDKRTLAIAAGLAAITLSLLVNFLLGRTLFVPLRRLGEASKRLGSGDSGTRLNWKRSDELGVVAHDFDRMAEELHRVHSHLEAMALTDSLTKLLNHRAFQERMEQELRRAEREGYSVAVVALDVDHFKEINDRYGHATGDDALRQLAGAIRASLRPSDVCGRVGGDEFVMCLPRASAEDARQAVDRLRELTAEMRFDPGESPVTVSAGISEFPRHSLSRDELMHLADGAMYWAKSAGRNRTYVYTDEHDHALSPEEAAERVAQEGLVNTVHALAKAVDAKDGYTHSHSNRVAGYASALATAMGLDAGRIEKIRSAGVLHDVGKIGIADAVLLKPDKLTESEFEEMRRHSELGRDIIAGAGMEEVAGWVLYLHERFDGRGYPDGLKGDQIPLESRVLHVADALEAMTSSRVYRKALPLEEAIAEIEAGAGSQFDPGLSALMVKLVRSGEVEVDADEPDAEPIAEASQNGSPAGSSEAAASEPADERGDLPNGTGRAAGTEAPSH